MRPQVIFDVVLYGIRVQGGPSREGTRCLYRSPDGRRCAVGIWIGNNDYSRLMEGRLLSAVLDMSPKLQQQLGEHQELLALLQEAHDTTAAKDFFPRWEKKMQSIAAQCNLRYTTETPEGAEAAYKEFCCVK